ncbi:hypothetical protein DUI87_03040 [Hirundo rustica rustica]|uniref:Core shell protein Gag P30 domain-containing protein n=1 Tax=Hirundo rustica rustica TaxID=333673 RepID=A0A3M0LT29_HIRRU|nr:hypothetical protein DUI87_03040 [Hirundo rustica rustica]
MAPLRAAVGPQGDRVMVKVPFSPNDLMIWKQSAGSYREDPDRTARVVKMVIKTQNPDWNDLQVLLDTLMDSTEKEMVLRAMTEKGERNDKALLREQDDIELKITPHLNPAEFLRSNREEGELVHDCVEIIEQVYASREDLKDAPIDSPDWELFTDGSSFVENGTRVLYHQEEEMYRFLEETILLRKREVMTGITIAMLLGLGATGTATGVSALVTQHQRLSQLQMTIDEDLLRIEKSISSLERSISSLSEVVLQNRRGLDLLLMQ